MSGDAARNLQSIYSEPMLRMQKEYVQGWLDLSRTLKDFSTSGDWKEFAKKVDDVSFMTRLSIALRAGNPMLGLNALTTQMMVSAGLKAWDSKSAGQESSEFDRLASGPGSQERTQGASAIGGALGTLNVAGLTAAAAAADKTKISAEALYNIERERMEYLGQAATPAEKHRLELLRLNAAVEQNQTTQVVANRALAAYVLAQNQAAISVRTRLGIVREEELLQQGLRQLQEERANGYIRTDEEMAQAERLLRKEVEDTHNAMKVRTSEYPQLTRAIIEAKDSAKQLDTTVVRSIDTISDGLSDAATGTTKLSDAFSNMASSIIRDLIRIQMRNALVSASGSLMSMFNPTGGAGWTNGAPQGVGLGGYAGSNALGGVFESGRSYFRNRGIFTNSIVDRSTPFRFAKGGGFAIGEMGEAGPEAIMPLRRGRGGRLGVEMFGAGGGGGNMEVNIFNQAPGVQVERKRSRKPGGGGERLDVTIKAIVRDAMLEDQAGNGEITQGYARRFGLDATRGMAG